MPKLPDKFDLGGAPSVGRRPITQASASDFSTGGGLMVANEVVKGVGGLAKIAIAKQEEADDYEVQKSIVDFDLEQEKRLDDAKRNAPPEAKDFTSSYRRGYDEAATGLMTRVPERLKPQVDTMLVKRRAAFEKRAYDFELAERDRWNIQDVGGRLEDSYSRVISKPDALRDEINRTLPIINQSRLPARTKFDLRRKYLDSIHEYAIDADIANAAQPLDGGKPDIDRLREIDRRLRMAPRGALAPEAKPDGSLGPRADAAPGAWKVYDKDVPTAAERKAIFNGGGVVVNLDSNWAKGDKPTSPMVVIPDGATSEQRQAAEAYAAGIAQIYNEKFGTDLKPRVVTRSQNGRGRPGTIHTEPFSVNDTRAAEFFTSDEGRKAHAGLLRETFGKVSGVAFSLPHDETRKGDKGAVGPRGSEVDIARALIADLKGSDGGASGSPFGVEIRTKLFAGEDKFFKDNPTVAGMAAEDGKVILNPYSKNSKKEQEAVALNEAARVYMKQSGTKPDFALTDEQKAQFSGTPYAKDEQAMRETIAARILSGDPSAKDATDEQKAFVKTALKPAMGGGDPKLVEGPSEVTRRDLGPVQVAQASTGTMTDAGPDTGTALTKEGQSGAIDGGSKDDDLVESDTPEYEGLTAKTRRKLRHKLRNAMVGIVSKDVDDDIARLRLGRPVEADAQGRTSLDRARGTLTPLQLETKTRAWKEAGLEREELTALRRMPLDEADNHVASIVDRAEKNDIPVSAAAKVQAKAQTTLEKMRVMSNTDPVRLVTGSFGDEADDRMPPAENVAKVMRILKENRTVVASTGPDGMALRVGPEGRIPRVTDDDAPSEMPGRIGQAPIPPREQWKMLLDARIADQRALMPYDDHKYRLLNAKEAEQLLGMPKGKELSKTDYKKHLEGVWERTQQKFPPEYANKVFKEAINHHLKGDVDGAKADIIYKVAKGQPLTKTDFDRVRQIEEINSTSLSASFENQAGLSREGASPFVDTMARIDRAGRSQGMPALGTVDPALPSIATVPRGVTQGQVAAGRTSTPQGLPKSPNAKEHMKAIPPDDSLFGRSMRWFTQE